ncbi:MAG: hypothetical protein RLZZ401_1748 [Pseudomonadota bacterium]|jgi:hypothetical protein
MMRSLVVAVLAGFLSAAVLAAPGADDIRAIQARFVQEKLGHASVELADDGRLKLAGQFKDRAEVQLAFTLAQQVVGVRWVAPTTPENVRYPGTEAFKSGILAALRKARPVATVTSSPPAEGERYGLVVGVGTYAESKIGLIENAPDDARAFHALLQSKRFKPENLTLLLNEQATKQNVSQAFADLGKRVVAGDTVVLYFSTHGSQPNDKDNQAIVLYDTRIDMKLKRVVPDTAVQDDELKRFVESVSPARVMVVLDICYSGAAFSKIPGFLASSSKDLFVEESNFASGLGKASLTYLAGTSAQQEKILIAASGPGEKSWSNRNLGNGFFTHYFVKELQGKNDVLSAYLAAKPVVQSEVRRIVGTERNDPSIGQTPQATFIPDSANLKF